MKHLTESLLLSYELDELSLDEKQLIEAHIAVCHRCKNSVDEIKNLSVEWTNPSQTPPVTFAQNVMKEIEQSHQYERVRRIGHKKQSITHLFLAGAATFVFINTGIFNEVTNVSFQFIGGISDITNQIDVITTKSKAVLQSFDIDTFMHIWKKE